MTTESGVSRAEVTVNSPLFSPFRQRLEGLASIGRASECTIPIKDRYLSRRHAEIVPVGRNWFLKDLGSANGTYLNGARVERDMPLQAGDRIRLGDTEIVFVSTERTTDRMLAVADRPTNPTIAIPANEVDSVRAGEGVDVARLQTLTLLARELIEDRPIDELFGFILERVLAHLSPSRAALGLLAADRKSFVNVEVRRQDSSDQSDLTISHTLLTEVVEEKKALAFMDVSIDEKLSRADSIVSQGIRSIICAPLIVNDSVEGVLYVDFLFSQRPISEDDVRLVAQVARFAAIKLEQTRLREQALQKRIMDEELKTASMIQRRLLAPAPEGVRGYTFAGANRACRGISGDYYDFVTRSGDRVYFVIGDVSGKGITAGLMMAGLQSAFRIYTKSDPDPATLVSQLNTALKENLPQSKFVTLFLGRLDTTTGIVEYANAGHTPPLLVRSAGVEELSETDILLGVVTRADYVNRRIHMEPGDALVLFTDGVTEAENLRGELLGPSTLANALAPLHGRPAADLAAALDDTVTAHAGHDEDLGDDVTLVVVSRDLF